MCGICGVATHFMANTEVSAFKELLTVSQLRGSDSTGVAAIHKPQMFKRNHEKVRTFPYQYDKDTENSSVFLDDPGLLDKDAKRRKSLFTNNDVIALFGHCRSATVGAVSKANAHPFDFSNVIGVHNGTIRQGADIPELKEFESDSAALYASINKRGIEDTVDRLGKFGGAYSLVYFDKTKGTLNFIRNDERPMFFMYGGYSQDVLYWASEAEFLRLVAHRKNIKISEGTTIFSLKPWLLWSIGIGNGHNYFLKDNMTTADLTPVVKQYSYSYTGAQIIDPNEFNEAFGVVNEPPVKKPYVPPAMINHTANPQKGSTEAEVVQTFQQLNSKYQKETKPSQSTALATTSEDPTPFKGFNARPITRREFEKALSHGCALCCQTIDPNEGDIQYRVGWADPGLVVCPDCIGDPTEFTYQFLVNNINKKELPNVG